MPDRFVVMGYVDDAQVFRHAGAPVPDPLILGPDPLNADAEYLQQDGDLRPGPDFAWVTDFDDAPVRRVWACAFHSMPDSGRTAWTVFWCSDCACRPMPPPASASSRRCSTTIITHRAGSACCRRARHQ